MKTSPALDQRIAATEDGLELLIGTGRTYLDKGLDRSMSILALWESLVLMLQMKPDFHDEALIGLAIAIVRLAEGQNAAAEQLTAVTP